MWYTLSPSSFLSDVLSAVSVFFSSLAFCPAVQPVNAATVMDIASNNAITFFMFVSSNVFFSRQRVKALNECIIPFFHGFIKTLLLCPLLPDSVNQPAVAHLLGYIVLHLFKNRLIAH